MSWEIGDKARLFRLAVRARFVLFLREFPSQIMKTQNSSNAWKNAAKGLAVFGVVGGVTYLALSMAEQGGKGSSAGALKTEEGSEAALVLGSAPTVASSGTKAPASGTGGGPDSRKGALLSAKAPVEGAPLVAAGMNPDSDKGRVLRLKPAAFKKP